MDGNEAFIHTQTSFAQLINSKWCRFGQSLFSACVKFRIAFSFIERNYYGVENTIRLLTLLYFSSFDILI